MAAGRNTMGARSCIKLLKSSVPAVIPATLVRVSATLPMVDGIT
ncbi:MAG: hypothetical protein ACRDYY_13155 [Acidimicrobiales bacterium]